MSMAKGQGLGLGSTSEYQGSGFGGERKRDCGSWWAVRGWPKTSVEAGRRDGGRSGWWTGGRGRAV